MQNYLLQQTYQQPMSLDPDDFEEAYQREDLHALASQAQRNNFNIRKFKDKSLIKDKRKSLYTKYTEPSSKNRISTEPIEDRFHQIKSSMSYTNAFQRIMSKNEPDHNKRNNFVGSLKGKIKTQKKYSIDSYDQKLKNDKEEGTDIETEKAEQFKKMSKKHHKGPINKKIIQTWLNSILMETIQFEILDESLGNAALKKFEIDENSLLSRAIKPQNINKIYQSLFVHSIGFNNNIKELVNGNTQVLKNIWKVYSILLEYCAQGKFETLIGVIERQKAIKLEQLREEVARRQQIIQRNDELNETKNIQIFKQIKNLKQQNINLTNEKDILFEDYQKTEQAFNEEVALRLRFENKINQLFGVHRQLAVKHQRLYDDYKRKVLQWNAANQKNTQLNLQNGELKIQLNDLLAEKQRLLSSEKYNKQLIMALKDEKVKIKDQYNMVKHNYDEERRLSKQLKRRATQLQIEVKNLTQIVSIKDKSWKQTHSEYQISLQENNRLYFTISEQRIQVQALLFEKKQFNNKILNLMAEASFEKKKKQQFTKFYYDADKKLNQQNQKLKDLELEIKIMSKKNESIQNDLQSNYTNIKSMHEKNNELEDELHFLRRFRDNLDSVIEEKQNIAERFRIENQKINAENDQLKLNLNKSQMELKLTKAELKSEISNLNHKLERLHEQTQLLQSGEDEKNKILTNTRMQLERITKLLQNTVMDLKNEKFERFNLKANYEQSLSIIEKKNSQEKQMGRQISELKQLAAKTTREKDKMTFAYESQLNKRQRCQQKIIELQNQFSEYKEKKSTYIHGMLYEDVSQNYRIVRQKLETATTTIKIKQSEIKDLHQRYKNQIQQLKKSTQDYFDNFKKQKQKQIFQKQSQLEYEKQIKASMKVRLDKLETLADTYAKKIEERTTSEKEKVYAELIQQKTRSIQQLMQKLNMESSKNEVMTKQMIKKKEEHDKQVIEMNKKFKEEKDAREQKISELNFEIQLIQKQSQKLIQQVKQHETMFQTKLKQRMEIYLQEYKKSSINETHLQSLSEVEKQQDKEKGEVDQKNNMNHSNANWSLLQKIERRNPQIRKRNDISKKIKNAYSYYKH